MIAVKIEVDVLVIGRGVAGVYAAYLLAKAGKKVAIAAKGCGATPLYSGCLDVLAYVPEIQGAFQSPLAGMDVLAEVNERHPYVVAGGGSGEGAREIVEKAFAGLPEELEKLHVGSLDRNSLVLTSFGTLRPTAFVQWPMGPAVLDGSAKKILLVGIEGYLDFNPVFSASMASREAEKRGLGRLEFVPRRVAIGGAVGIPMLTPNIVASALEDEGEFKKFESELAELAKREGAEVLLLPPIFSTTKLVERIRELESACGCRVGEVPSPPTSAAGMRILRALRSVCERAGIRIYHVAGLEPVVRGREVEKAVGIRRGAFLEEAGGIEFEFEHCILATGDLVGGGVVREGAGGELREAVFGLPLYSPEKPIAGLDPFDPRGQPFSKVGVLVDEDLRPVDRGGGVVYEDLYAAGAVLGCYDYVAEKSGMGVAITTAYKAALSVLGR